jgi:hypothetical protein
MSLAKPSSFEINRALSAPAGARARVEMRWPVTRGHPYSADFSREEVQ